ncbi:penicillin acylase family protein [Ktedonospora formicarum]|uniref:Peptidase S45 n=1 Tax=Ktedonospora formicarum TaxID=2778364 RepID=A0A8J3I5R5_9CHLR|nr:penicillin acylase family protein [Ktedonospora formicarum]GHO45249.1 peptidase S45 [Ktedonospora formicarum]
MASWWRKTIQTAEDLAGFASGSFNLLSRCARPQKQGTLHFAELHDSVEIITDHYGVPHIYARNEDDLFFAQGFIHAQERLWQMELNRRIGAGRLSEIVGPVALEVDRFSRRLGMHRSALEGVQQLPEQMKQILTAYVLGVNTYIKHHQRQLPAEFAILRFRPDPWRLADCLQWGKMIGWNLSGNWETELTRARLVASIGVERAAKLEAGYDPAHPLIIPPGVAYQGINPGLLDQYERIKELTGFGMMGGSNNWVVDGTMTTTGLPILCNDPHLGQAAPSIWFECHLNMGDLDVVGASFPGSPGVVIGHNRHIAWGVTNAVSDVQDLYIEKFNPDNPNQYEYQGQWENAKVYREYIKIKGEEPVVEDVRVTRHGPIITKMPPLENMGEEKGELPLALRWTGLEQCNIAWAVQKINRATNWDEFREGLRDWDVPPQNFVYADRQGNIGYVMAGSIPIRPQQQQALLPSPGWTGEYEWQGYIPFDELPQTFNPEQHFIATANNRVIDDNYPYYISNEWLNGYRAQRIRDLLTSSGKLTPADMARIQADQYSLPAEEFVPYILSIEPRTPHERAAQDILRTWDHVLSPESIGAAIYTTFLRKLTRLVLDALVGEDQELINSYLGVGATIMATLNGYASRERPLLIRLLKEHDDDWFAENPMRNGPHSWSEALRAAFEAALGELRDKRGENLLNWQYGSIHRMTYNHALGSVKALEKIFNRGPYAVGGDIDTVNMGTVSPAEPETVITVPSYRQIVDLADLSHSLSGHAPGQSGHANSEHYDDFIQMWLDVRHHPMLFERKHIETLTEGTLILHPPHP